MPNLYQQVGERIRILRLRGYLTQAELARKARLHPHLSEIECGECNVCLQTLEAICRTLNVSIEKLFRGIGSTRPKKRQPGRPSKTQRGR